MINCSQNLHTLAACWNDEVPELQQGPFFYLAYPLSSNPEFLTTFLQSMFFPGFIQAESHSHDLLLAGRQRLQSRISHFTEIIIHHGLFRGNGVLCPQRNCSELSLYYPTS